VPRACRTASSLSSAELDSVAESVLDGCAEQATLASAIRRKPSTIWRAESAVLSLSASAARSTRLAGRDDRNGPVLLQQVADVVDRPVGLALEKWVLVVAPMRM
jgi:hypothetical protein